MALIRVLFVERGLASRIRRKMANSRQDDQGHILKRVLMRPYATRNFRVRYHEEKGTMSHAVYS